MDSLHCHLCVLLLFIAVLWVSSIMYENQICRVRSMVSYLRASSMRVQQQTCRYSV